VAHRRLTSNTNRSINSPKLFPASRSASSWLCAYIRAVIEASAWPSHFAMGSGPADGG
jgi:hypothetical protein